MLIREPAGHTISLLVTLLFQNVVQTTQLFQHPIKRHELSRTRTTASSKPPEQFHPQLNKIVDDSHPPIESNSFSVLNENATLFASPRKGENPRKKDIFEESMRHIMLEGGPGIKLFVLFASVGSLLGGMGIFIISLVLSILLLFTWKFQNLLGKLFAPIMISRVINFGTLYWDNLRNSDGSDDSKYWSTSEGDTRCRILAVIYNFTSLVDFTWLTVVSFNFWWDLGRKFPKSPNPNLTIRRQHESWKYYRYSVFDWVVPILVLGVSIGLDRIFGVKQKIMERWILSKIGNELSRSATCKKEHAIESVLYAVPFSMILMIVIVTLSILTIKSIRVKQRETKFATESKAGSSISSFKLFWKLSLLMGLQTVLYSLFTICIIPVVVAMEIGYLSGETGVSLYMGGTCFIVGLGFFSTFCLFHFFFWSKREQVVGQAKQVLQDILEWLLGSYMSSRTKDWDGKCKF